ncbi:MAG: family 43 glycosylhydrolase [Clostridia bacterium]|nr:family 43 glycosylhydrolase [Clostridia bacterium]
MIKRSELRIRDPFILTDTEAGCYYMYGTIGLRPGGCATPPSFSVCKTYDLENFEEPKVIFDATRIPFWADRDFWAPEVHKYGDKYYLLGSCKAPGKHRATHIFVCDTPDGEYKPLSDEPVTPPEWDCLDGTLFVEGDTPYMVFCHEWAQVKNGEICAVPLSGDLSRAVGDPILLFKATDNPAVGPTKYGIGNYVTDGPFLYCEDNKVKMIWSSYYEGRYLVLEAESDSIHGKWIHKGSKFDFDGGHAMLFTSLQGKRMMVLHSPNTIDLERAVFFEF